MPQILLGVALPAILISVLRRHSLGHDATATAFTAAQAFHEGGDWRVKLEVETDEIVSRQTSFVPTMQASDLVYRAAARNGPSCIAHALASHERTKIRFVKAGHNASSFVQDIPALGFLSASAAVLLYASVRLFVCSPNAFANDCINSV